MLICGYQPDEEGKVKDLILGYFDEEGKLQCRGKVYLGISKEERQIIEAFAKNNRVSKPWFAKYRNAVWLKPNFSERRTSCTKRGAAVCASPSGRGSGKINKRRD